MKKTATLILVTTALALCRLPARGQEPGSSAVSTLASRTCAPAEKYVKTINDGKYDAVGGLFADDAVYMGPDGKTRHGSKDIGAFYGSFLPVLKPQLRASKFFANGNDCMMELENRSRSGEFAPIAVDHFTIDPAGKISRFVVYLRPGAEGTRSLRQALSKTR